MQSVVISLEKSDMILVKTDMNMVKSELLHGQYIRKMEFLGIFQCQNLFSYVTLAFSSLDVLYFLSLLKGPPNDLKSFLMCLWDQSGSRFVCFAS